jgi:hypothetical protein
MKNLHYLFALLIIILLNSCQNDYTKTQFSVHISDTLNILNQTEIDTIKTIRFTEGILPVILAVDSINKMTPGVSADEYFEQISDTFSLSDAFENRGFMILISKNPALIQTRCGSEISSHAQWQGITAGSEYLKIQQTSHNDSLAEALQMLKLHLESKLAGLSNISWWDKMQYNQAAAILSDEMEEFGLPSESFYGDKILQPVLKLRLWELKRFNTWWMTYLFIAVIIFMLNKLVEAGIDKYAKKIKEASIRSMVKVFVTAIVGIFLSIPALSSATILSSGRLEDILALQAFGLPFQDYLSINTSAFGAASPLWLVIIFAVVRLLKGMGEHYDLFTLSQLPDKQQRLSFAELAKRNSFISQVIELMATRGSYNEEILSREEFLQKPYYHAYFNQFNKEASKAGLWAFLALGFLSKAIVMAALFLWLLPLAEAYIKYYKAIKKFNAQHPENKIKMRLLIITPLFFGGIMFAVSILKKLTVYFLFMLLVLLSSGILMAIVLHQFYPLENSLFFWIAVLILPVYYVIRLLVASFQTMEKLTAVFKRYIIITLSSLAILIYFYYKKPQMQVYEFSTRIFPQTAELLTKHELKKKILHKGVTTAKSLNVRAGESTSHTIIGSISPADTFDIISKNKHWWHIRMKEKEGYISSKFASELNIE